MSGKMPHGKCNICGRIGLLSYEHVPPESAFNDRKVLVTTAESYWSRGPGRGQPARGEQLQRGYGRNSLCERCNHTTGRWYVHHFARWCRQGMEYHDRTKGQSALLYFSTLFPLAVLKQVVTMFLARAGDGFRDDKKEPLVRFVLNKEQRYLDPKFKFWVYFVAPGPLRDTPVCSILDIKTGHSTHGSEFSFPPFGYMMTLGSRPEDPRLTEITHFSRYGYLDMAQLGMTLALLPTHTPVLGDYRTFKNMERKPKEPNVFVRLGHKQVPGL